LKEHGIFTGIHYPIPVHLQKAMEFLGYKQGDLPVTEQVVSQILSLPMYAELTADEIEYVAESIKAFYG
jgi:dTDP-4-amino-4,6-dideoxygalactose transaminase